MQLFHLSICCTFHCHFILRLRSGKSSFCLYCFRVYLWKFQNHQGIPLMYILTCLDQYFLNFTGDLCCDRNLITFDLSF
ncbi:Uncharacterised protein [Mycobacterium tuberculosis]|nr:Uncharacterised protein [Mycobacterium tuberculosis]